ncbi:MAG: hypothetical protein Q8O67_29050 [Deltaproteobacteria bacterium]|nr:hypothetical protein [Deltaproteobacteria bacterium]
MNDDARRQRAEASANGRRGRTAALCRLTAQTIFAAYAVLVVATVAALHATPELADSSAHLGLFAMSFSLGFICLPGAILLGLASVFSGTRRC